MVGKTKSILSLYIAFQAKVLAVQSSLILINRTCHSVGVQVGAAKVALAAKAVTVNSSVVSQTGVGVAEEAIVFTLVFILPLPSTLNVCTSEPFNISNTSSVSAAEPLFQVIAHLVESVTTSGLDELSRTCWFVAVPITQGLLPQANGLLSTILFILVASHFMIILATATNQDAWLANNQ